jgi:hypothetical protein
LGAGEVAAEGVIEAVIRTRLAKAANTRLRPAAEIIGPLFILTFLCSRSKRHNQTRHNAQTTEMVS